MQLLRNQASAVTTPPVPAPTGPIAVSFSVSGAGTVSAQAVLEGTIDGVSFYPVATLSASGTASGQDGGALQSPWPQLRVRLTQVTGQASLDVHGGR